MSDFDPNWPHGHLFKRSEDERLQATIRLTNARGEYPIVAEVLYEGGWEVETFTENGFFRRSGVGGFRLINRPAPEPVVVEVRRHINDYFFRGARTPDGLPPHVRIETTATLFSDGSVRASAEVVK